MAEDQLQRLAAYVWLEVGSMASDPDEVAWLTERVGAGDFLVREFPGSVLEVEIGAGDPDRGPWVLITSSDPDDHFAAAFEDLVE